MEFVQLVAQTAIENARILLQMFQRIFFEI
jgi:hypothetical protein